LPEQEAIAKTCGTSVEYIKTFNERLKPSFINHFYPQSENIGLDAFTENYGTFAKFSNKMVAYHKNHNMCDLSMKEYRGRSEREPKWPVESGPLQYRGVGVRQCLLSKDKRSQGGGHGTLQHHPASLI
jgi:hypothetical protein